MLPKTWPAAGFLVSYRTLANHIRLGADRFGFCASQSLKALVRSYPFA